MYVMNFSSNSLLDLLSTNETRGKIPEQSRRLYSFNFHRHHCTNMQVTDTFSVLKRNKR